MDFVVAQTYLGDILRIVSDSLLAPDIVLLLLFIGYAVFCIGSILVELFTEHLNFKVYMPQFLSSLADAPQSDVVGVIQLSGLLNRQKVALLTVFDYRTLPGDMLIALVKRLLNEEDTHYQRILNRNNIAVRVAPMLGLMGTLIPLGPGIAALGQGDVGSLSSSLVIAFNTTVAGLAAAAVCLVIARIRKTWYNNYMNALESAMASLLQKIGQWQDDGVISVTQPENHAFLFKQSLKGKGQVPPPAELPPMMQAPVTEVQPTGGQPTEAQPTETQLTEWRPTEAQSAEAQPTEAQPANMQPMQVQQSFGANTSSVYVSGQEDRL